MNATTPEVPPAPAGAGGAGGAAVAGFDEFYRAHHPGLVAMAYALVGDLPEAQDLVQEAFCRAWRRWDTIVGYDSPAAWVRRVAANLASSRWRHLRVARGHQRRERAVDVPGLEPDHVALVAALRTLPDDQRRVLVLHHLVDLPVTEVAADLGVPVGTVKSWLHRGRAALAARLGDAFEGVNGDD
jgi:RNA polymerase sigma-70 factor (ECF subfamily)